ncbi:MBL fold metallo-hydrolase RNA specificity domain-containing protein [Methanolobus sp. WCC1]|uniref:MBL fold metallo-hydrolase RNA specificity domain-containing protein n=1 Tax=unclassified Methanolobus TaxID=2629569 RepID=UPI003255B65B
MVSIEVLGGDGEIGGNKILIEHKGTRIFLDFGMSFKQNGLFFSEFLNPRKCSGLGDFFEFGLLPDLQGIYREDYLAHMDRSMEERSIDAVFLSHAHADHAQYIHFLRWDIPIYCTQATKIILGCIQETGSNTFSDFIDACESFKFTLKKDGGLTRVKRIHKEYIHKRNFQVMEINERVSIGNIEVEMFPVDHSLPGACGFIIYTDEGNIVYTGDIRFHGSHGHLSREFVEKARESSPKWMLCEGTRVDSEMKDSEAEVQKKMSELIYNCEGPVFVEHPVRDIDRVNSIFKAAQENERDFVIPLKLAYLVESLDSYCPFCLDDVKILNPKKTWGLISKIGIEKAQVAQDYDKWERNFINQTNSITLDKIRESQKDYVLSMSQWEINQLADIKPTNGLWIKSSCDPFCDEMELDEKRKMNWLEHFDIHHETVHASGHASSEELKEMIKKINPDILIPIHTEKPELFKDII